MKVNVHFLKWVVSIGIMWVLSACSWYTADSTQLTLGISGIHSAEIKSGRNLSRAAITEAYPSLKTIELSVSTKTLTTVDINEQFNDGKFKLNAAKTAFVLSDTVVDLVVPNSETLTITVTAFNLGGYKVFSGSVAVSVADLAKPSLAIAVPIEVDIDEAIPVLASLTECVDSDGDNLCDVYEDLFLNADGIADIDNDDVLNRDDLDTDNDGVEDNYDYNSTLNPNGMPTQSNNGYPMFVVANRAPVIADVTVTTSENLATTLSLPASSVDADVNDVVTYYVSSDPTSGTVVVNGTDIRYTPNLYFVGTDNFTVEVMDLAFSYTDMTADFVVTVNVIDNPQLGNRPPVASDDPAYQSTQGAHIVLDVLANDSDPDQISGDQISLLSANSDQGEVRISRDKTKLLFKSERRDTDGATINYTIQDSFGLTAQASLIVWMNTDNDGDGLSATVATNGSSILDSDDSNPDSDGDGFSDYYESFTTVAVSSVNGTVVTGQISTDTVWDITGSPYVVTGTGVQVTTNAELRIEQGVEVKFEAGASLNITPGSSLFVMGGESEALKARFTSVNDDTRQPVAQSAQSAAAGDWNGIALVSALESQLHNATVMYATIALSLTDSNPLLDHLTVERSSGTGLTVSSSTGAPSVIDSVFAVNKQGVEIKSIGADLSITNTVFRGNSGGNGASGYGGGLSTADNLILSVSVTNSLFVQNSAESKGGAVYVGVDSPIKLLGNTFAENSIATLYGGAAVYVNYFSSPAMLAVDNIFAENDDCNEGCYVDVIGNDPLAVVTESKFNITDDAGNYGSVLFNLSSATFAESPTSFLNGWYLFQDDIQVPDDMAVNTGSIADVIAAPPSYLSRLRNPTTNIDGSKDTGQVDIGYHYSAAARVGDAKYTTVTPASFIADPVNPIVSEIIVRPFDTNGVWLGPIEQLTIDDSTELNLYSAVFEYIGNGEYRLPFTLPAEICQGANTPQVLNIYQNLNVIGTVEFNIFTNVCG